MSRIATYSLLLFLNLFPFARTGRAETPLTIEKAVAVALDANPSLKAKEASAQAFQARIGVARSLDDPMIGVEFEEVPIDTVDVTQGAMTNYSVIQKFPFPSKLVTQGRAAKKNYLAEKSGWEAEKIGLIVAVENAFYDLYFWERALKINRELQGLFKKMAASEEGEYTTGSKSSHDFLKTKVEFDKLQSEGAMLEAKKIEAQARLNILMNKNPMEEILLAELPSRKEPAPSYEAFEKKVLERHPELKSAEYEYEASKSNLSLARQQNYLPDFQTRFSYNQRYGQIDAWTGEAMINIPFLWGKNRKMAKEARFMKKASENRLASVRNEKLSGLKETYALFVSGQKIADLYRARVLPQAAIALKSSEAAYASGDDSFLSLIDSARGFKEAKLAALQAELDYHRAATRLKEAVGEDWTK